MNIKVKRLLLLALLLGTTQIKAQQITSPQLPIILPPAPNAGELGKYGNIPINFSTGAVNYNIPLVSMTSGALKLDIAVSYNSGGVKVDQIASRAGLGWILNAGGVITRTVYGDPDETALTAPVPSNPMLNTPEVISFLDRVVLNKDKYDTQPDIFNFNFNGNSGRFIINPNDRSKIIFLEKSNIQVQTNFLGTLGSQWTIKVIDANGISYYFGGSTATEKSRTQNSGQGCGKTYDLGVQNAWYLNKIEDLNGDNILLSYLPVQVTYPSSATQTILEQNPETRGTYLQDPVDGSITYPYPGYSSICITTIVNTGVILDKIVSSKGTQIQFSYINRNDVDGDKLVSKLEYGLIGKPYTKTFNFDYSQVLSDPYYQAAYSNVQNNYRPYLVGLTEWSQGLTSSKKHQFYYYFPNLLPSRLSYAQDHFGFFNGKNNSGFLPDPPRAGVFNYTPNNREPDASFAHIGMMRKIIYPTSGTDSILYESNTIQENLPPDTIPAKFSHILDVTGTGLYVSQSVTKNFSIDSSRLKLGLFCFYSGVGVADGIHQRAELSIKKLPGRTQVYYRHVFPDAEAVLTDILLDTGNYEVQLTANGQAAIGHAWIEGYYGKEVLPATSTIKAAGGARVKQVLTYDPVSGVNNVKSYSYNKSLEPAKSSGILLRPKTNYFSTVEMRRITPSKSTALFGLYTQASSAGDISLFANDGSHMMYSEVTTSDGYDLSNGATYYQYQINLDNPGWTVRGNTPAYRPYDISGVPSSLERYQLVYRVVSGQTVKLKETFNTYKINPYETFNAYQGKKNYDIDNYGGTNPYDIGAYKVKSYWNYNDSTKVVTYNTQGLNPLSSITENLYQNAAHLQLTEARTNTSDGKKIIKKLIYPHEMVSSAQDPTGIYAAMIAKNKIAPFVEEKELTGTGLVTDLKRTNYFQPYPNIFAAQSIETFNPVTSKNEVRIRFHKYNAKGNILNMSTEKGTYIGYLWSYNHQFPVAEIKGASQGTIESAFAAGVIDNFANLAAPDKTAIDNFLAPLKTALPLAHISAFVYEPLKGLVSQTDAKGMVTYYEYDSFQRLKVVKDHNQHIIKNYEYYYKP